ncbi:hypothetical protein Kpol_274p2 [Vanderwaltozyma polyspora DSM 70294]|uniref:Protein DSS4 n=1 Tax=Vanderwaltozyma polyspora (strain ATCC 22028 / DSM 70294 / BCRC 21397 / CBS 2163 / NBRC 10782 / NRRL Y-8283 / UCD 57-17) TaxID=436907 RepID=A7TT83_VANPO|nr:uncharacterized protein Kpol_274p2 [Vanderwaltozyma polyspora DSM 70294]EDO14519.1 hypothetical protein Kpol_274p2 [Vanderwaltozyma polyspora DSM 70294]
MGTAKCVFDNCNSQIITVDESKVIEWSSDVYDIFKLMQNNIKDVSLGKFLIVNDIWDFDNVGVSKEIPQDLELQLDDSKFILNFKGNTWEVTKCIKYLICADCDKGPIGMVCEIADVSNKDNKNQINLLSLNSINYEL